MTNTVFFPGLGLEFTLNRVAFTILGRPVYWYGVIIACGFLLGVLLCCRLAPRFGLTEDHVMDMVFYVAPPGLIGVRAYYVIFNLDLYRRIDGSLTGEPLCGTVMVVWPSTAVSSVASWACCSIVG